MLHYDKPTCFHPTLSNIIALTAKKSYSGPKVIIPSQRCTVQQIYVERTIKQSVCAVNDFTVVAHIQQPVCERKNFLSFQSTTLFYLPAVVFPTVPHMHKVLTLHQCNVKETKNKTVNIQPVSIPNMLSASLLNSSICPD